MAVFRCLARRLEQRGHEVSLQVGWDQPPCLDGDVLLVDHMTPMAGLEAAAASGLPVASVVHTMWSFVPSLEGTFAPAGYLDVLSSLPRNLVFGVAELDGGPFPDNVVHVGPLIEPAGDDVEWQPAGTPLVVVGLGTTPMGEVEVLQRLLDGLADVDVCVAATAGAHVNRTSLRIPPNATVDGFVQHSAMLPHADLFIGHAGHGGLMAALSFGVPIVSIPLDRDQPHNAARVDAVGAGRTVANDADPATIEAAVVAALSDAPQRAAAHTMAKAIAGYDGAAVAELESLLRE